MSIPGFFNNYPARAPVNSTGAPPYIIAEIGTSHGGSRDKARRLIAEAAAAGADCVKTQIVLADEILHPLTGTVMLPGGKIDLYKRFKSLEMDAGFYRELRAIAGQNHIDIFASVFGFESLTIALETGFTFFKAASPELNYIQLLERLNETGSPVILSTGISRLADIEQALKCFVKTTPILFHCVTSYPAPEEEYNCKLIENLSAMFGCPVGVSDHSMDPVIIPLLSFRHGAAAIEKHFTLDKTSDGLDDPVALDPSGFSKMTHTLKSFAGTSREAIDSFLTDYADPEVIKKAKGSGVKKIAECEARNYETTNRSIHARESLPAGTIISPDMISILRTEKNLTPGLPPKFLNAVTGKILTRPLEAGEGLCLEHLLSE